MQVVRLSLMLLLASSQAATQFENSKAHFDIKESGAVISVDFVPDATVLNERALETWVRSADGAVSKYLGHFPVSRVAVSIRSVHGSGVSGGRTFVRDRGGSIVISVGDKTEMSQLMADWILTHEMLHLAIPSLSEEHHWAEEGFSTYAEPIARLRAGLLTAERMWGEAVEGMPKGLPAPRDQGLDQTHTWGRTYWGGALFFLLADIEIRKQTHNRKGLEHAIRGIIAEGGNITEEWSMLQVLTAGDHSTNTHVLEDLYQKMKAAPVDVDLTAIWRQLGVVQKNGRIIFDDTAPLAYVRKGIETGDPLNSHGH